MALDTYTNLKVEIADTLDRSDLASQIDSFIDLAEARHKREIRIREMEKRATASLTDRFLSLPTDFLQMRALRLLTNPVTVVEQVSFHQMNRIREETTGTPIRFTIHEEIEFNQAPSSALTTETIYYAAFTPLSASNETNALLTRAPGLYLYGSLVASAPFLHEDERLTTWEALYNRDKDSLMLAERNSRHVGPLFSRVAGPTP